MSEICVKSRMRRYIMFCFSGLILGITACSTVNKPARKSPQVSMSPELNTMVDTSAVFSQDFVGFALYDPAQRKMIYSHNAHKYFTPASNNKLFSFYTGLRMLGDTLPAFRYVIRNDSLIFWGTGDPTFLHPDFHTDKSFRFLKNHREKLYYAVGNFADKPFGPGWAWDDYNYYYSPERAAFPIYGNVVRFSMDKITSYNIDTSSVRNRVSPPYFSKAVEKELPSPRVEDHIVRSEDANRFMFYPETDTSTETVDTPFKYSPGLMVHMLSDTLHKPVGLVYMSQPHSASTFYSFSADSMYKRMLRVSDNFLAEQLLLMCSSTLGDTLSTRSVIDYSERNFLADLPDKPVWVDGSGLSRFNLETPANMVSILDKLYELEPRDKLFDFLPTGGQTGTLKNYYKSDKPYIHGKTGTLSNNHNLSGYLITKSGKTLIFSLMVNHYVTSTQTVRMEMQNLLWRIHEMY